MSLHQFIALAFIMSVSSVAIASKAENADQNHAVESERDLIARWLVDELAELHGKDALMSLSVRSPKGYDFGSYAEAFARRVSIPFTKDMASLELRYTLEKTTGWFTGPNRRNYLLAVNLMLFDPETGGWEMLKTSSKRFGCDDLPIEKSRAFACSMLIQRHAASILYKLRDP